MKPSGKVLSGRENELLNQIVNHVEQDFFQPLAVGLLPASEMQPLVKPHNIGKGSICKVMTIAGKCLESNLSASDLNDAYRECPPSPYLMNLDKDYVSLILKDRLIDLENQLMPN